MRGVGVDPPAMGESDTPRQLANSMLGALLAVVHQSAGDDGVAQVLAAAGERRSAADLERPDGWSSYLQGLALFRAAADVLGDPDIGRKAGVEVFRRYAGTEVLALLRSIGSPGEMIRAYPAISAKQSTITRAEVVEVGESHGLISVTSPEITRVAFFCGYTVGALSQFPVLFGMEPAEVEEVECQTRGDPRCLIRVSWDPTSSVEASLEHEVVMLREQILVLTKRFESLESVAKELSSTQDVNSMLETITRRAGVAVRAPRYLLVAQLPGDAAPRIHHVGFTDEEAEAAAYEILTLRPRCPRRVPVGRRHRLGPEPFRAPGRLLSGAVPLSAPGAIAADGLRRARGRRPRDGRRPGRVPGPEHDAQRFAGPGEGVGREHRERRRGAATGGLPSRDRAL